MDIFAEMYDAVNHHLLKGFAHTVLYILIFFHFVVFVLHFTCYSQYSFVCTRWQERTMSEQKGEGRSTAVRKCEHAVR